MKKSPSSLRCGIVLAAGEGKRLQPLIRRLRGDSLPKQYVTLVGTRSMLEHTFDRAEALVPRSRLFTVVGKDHLGYPEARRQLSGRARGTVIAQPENRETGPGLLLPLMHLHKRYPDSTVAVFPSDHFVMEEDLFMNYVDLAFHVAEWDPASVVLLGMEPDEPEPEYGYIVPGEDLNPMALLDVRSVRRFVEKPDRRAAAALIASGALWNTFVMVFRVQAFLERVEKAAPELYESFQRVAAAIGSPGEEDVVREVYRDMRPVNFSTGLLEKIPLDPAARLLVVPVRGVLWSDWGSERRLVSALKKIDLPGPLPGVPGAFSLFSEK
ncbi:MAG TPA: sugar phosphate nucleotidyltransferase [Candidatus Binatia bacterium]